MTLASELSDAFPKHLPDWQANRNPVSSGVEGRGLAEESGVKERGSNPSEEGFTGKGVEGPTAL